MTDLLRVTSDLKVRDLCWDWGSRSRTPLKCKSFCLTYVDILPAMYKKTSILNNLPHSWIASRHLGPCPWVGLEANALRNREY